MSKPVKLLMMVVFNLLIVGFLAWQLLRVAETQGPSESAASPTTQPRSPRVPPQPPTPQWQEMAGHDQPGAIRWEGVWYVKPQQPAGALFAIAWPQADGRWKATFAGYWGQFLKYQVQTPGVPSGTDVLFEGEANLGSPDEQYQWKGRMTPDLFEGQYVHANSQQTGGFRLTPVKLEPASTQPSTQPATQPATPPAP